MTWRRPRSSRACLTVAYLAVALVLMTASHADGWLDLFVGNCWNGTERNSLYRNNVNANTWLVVKCVGDPPNTSAAGGHALTWAVSKCGAHGIAPGLYFCRLEAAGLSRTRRLVVLR